MRPSSEPSLRELRKDQVGFDCRRPVLCHGSFLLLALYFPEAMGPQEVRTALQQWWLLSPSPWRG